MTRPFGPALNAAVNLLTQNLTRDLNQLFSEEAKALELVEGWQANMQTRAWVWPEAPKPE
jgi:hypothetical protein